MWLYCSVTEIVLHSYFLLFLIDSVYRLVIYRSDGLETNQTTFAKWGGGEFCLANNVYCSTVHTAARDQFDWLNSIYKILNHSVTVDIPQT